MKIIKTTKAIKFAVKFRSQKATSNTLKRALTVRVTELKT